jgi:imidazole glycerol phosphate synthase subunit HisF
VPLVISGGANGIKNIKEAFAKKADACCVGSMFVFRNQNRKSILINTPNRVEIDNEVL